MNAEIIPTGTEILLGNIIDTNCSFLASQLPLLGIDLFFVSTAGDNRKRLVSTLRRAWKRADLIVTTGGLGPTQDDITREAIGELVNEELEVDGELWQELQDLLRRYRGLSSDRFEQAFTHRLRGSRSRMKQRAVYAALFDPRKALLEEARCT